MIPEIRNHSYHQQIQHLDQISLVQRRLRLQLIEVFKYLNEFTTASARGLFDYDLNDRTRNNEAKLFVKYFNTSVAKHFYPIQITTTWNALPSKVVSSRTVNSIKNILDKHWVKNIEIQNWDHKYPRVHKQSYASVFLEMDPMVCPTTTNTTVYINRPICREISGIHQPAYIET